VTDLTQQRRYKTRDHPGSQQERSRWEDTMSNADIIRAWKDQQFRSTLANVSPRPAGEIELADPGL